MMRTIESLRNKRIGLALSGGAVRGLAHIVVIKALHQFGIRPSLVAGTSVGSIIGAALSAGKDWHSIAELARSLFWPFFAARQNARAILRSTSSKEFRRTQDPICCCRNSCSVW